MLVSSVPRRFRAMVMVLLLTLAALPAFPATSSAQGSSASAYQQALAYLASVPGLDGQLHSLRVTTDPRGDAADSGDAIWAALGEVVLNKKLRNWVRKLAESKTGWGRDQLPPAGTPVLATFVGLADKPDLKGTVSTVVHQGYSDGTRAATRGFRASPFETDHALDSFGIFYREGVGAYPQAASSLVSAAGVEWYSQQFRGSGGVRKDVIGNVVKIREPQPGGNPPPGGGGGGGGAGGGVPPPGGGGNPPPGGGGGGGGGGGAGGGNGDGDGSADAEPMEPENSVSLVVESTPAGATDSSQVSRDEILWYAGAYGLLRDFPVDGSGFSCANTIGTVTPGGQVLVEVNLQIGSLLDLERLRTDFTVQAFGPDGELIGEFRGDWDGLVPGWMYRGVFRLPLPASSVGSVRVTPGADVRTVGLSPADPMAATPDGGTSEDRELTEGRAAYALSATPIAVPGRDGTSACTTVASPNVDPCGDAGAIDDALPAGVVPDGDVGQVETSLAKAINGSPQCVGSIAGVPAFVLHPTGVVSTLEGAGTAAADSGCAVEAADDARSTSIVRCDLFTALVWLAADGAMADVLGASGDVDDDDYLDALEDLGVVFEILFVEEFLNRYDGDEEELFNHVVDFMDGLYANAEYRPAYPRG